MSWSLLTPLFYLLLRRRFDGTVSACCTATMMLTPVFWETGTYFHPVVPALALLAGAILLFDRVSGSPGGISAFVAVTFLAAAATVMRNEVLITVPALLAAAAFSNRPRRNVALTALITALSVLAFILTARAVSEGGPEGPSGFLRRFSSGLIGSASPRGLLKTVPWAVMSMGTASVLLATWGILRMAAKSGRAPRDRRAPAMVIPALLWAAPVVLTWLLWPVPVLRHYFFAVPAVVYLLAALVLRGRSRRAVIVISAAVIILNLGLPEALYRSYNSIVTHAVKEPHGTFFYRHSLVEERIGRYHVLWDRLSGLAETTRSGGYRCTVLPADWEIFGYAVYRLAGLAGQTGSESDPASGITVHRFETPGSVIYIFFSGRFALGGHDDKTDYMDLMERWAMSGCALLLPAERAEKAVSAIPLPLEIIAW